MAECRCNATYGQAHDHGCPAGVTTSRSTPDLTPPPGPRERALREHLSAQWNSPAAVVERRRAAAVYRRAGEALLRAATLYETTEHPREVGAQVVPIVPDLLNIIEGYAIGTVLRQTARRHDAKGN